MRISDWSSDVCSSDLFLREQLLHEFRMRAGEENLRPAIFAANIQDDRTDAIADAHYFARDLLIAADNTLGAAQIDDDMTELAALHDSSEARRVGIEVPVRVVLGGSRTNQKKQK